MREILIATILLGCLFTFTSAERGLFEFHDSYGRCWRCMPGSACVRCSTSFVPFVTGPPDEWDRACGRPTEATCAEYLGVKFPHQDIGFYWICADDNVIKEVECFCDHVFDMRKQECVTTNDLTTIACDTYANSDPHDCASEDPRPPPSTLDPGVTTPSTIDPGVTTPSIPTAPTDTTSGTGTTGSVPTAPTDTTPGTGTTPSVPTAPTDTTPGTGTTPSVPTVPGSTPSVPTAPNESTKSTTVAKTTPLVPTAPNESTTKTETTTTGGITDPITIPTRTTEVGGPDGWPPVNTETTTSESSITTPAPCVCIVWWPCWCNPCWNMPCHSCNGCVGMMG